MSATDEVPMRWVAIQRNPRSGSGLRRRILSELIGTLRMLGFRTRLFKDRDRLQRWVGGLDDEDRLECIVAAGGDGTIADMFNRFPGVPLAVLPMGTENLVARHLGIPESGSGVARLIASKSRRRFDLGLVESRRFALLASAGFDADVIQRLHFGRRGNITRATYLQPILDSLRKYEYPPLRVYVDDAPTPRVARLAAAVNMPAYALGLSLAPAARGDDGSFELRLFERGSIFQMARYLCNLALGTHEKLPDVTSLTARRVRIESDLPVPVQADGDPAGFTPVEISVLPGALELIAPAMHKTETKCSIGQG
jgi:diacylglycerol kinase family enzyme